MDQKTSVNKIGEIINFSQILNSLFWDNVAHGETFEQNMDLYADIAQLDVMSNLEIDKAKKIFEVDNSEELRILKKKYPLNDEEGLQIQPKFFMHIARKKGYYIEGRKNYKDHKTTMDYVQTIINKTVFKSRMHHNLGKEPLYTVLNKDRYVRSEVRSYQITKIIEIISRMRLDIINVHKLSRDEFTEEEKQILIDRIEYDAIVELSKYKIGYSTAYSLLRRIDMDKDLKKIKTYLFFTLLSIPSNEFFKVFDNSSSSTIIVDTDNNYDCLYYGVGYKHYYQMIDGELIEIKDVKLLPKTIKEDDFFCKI